MKDGHFKQSGTPRKKGKHFFIAFDFNHLEKFLEDVSTKHLQGSLSNNSIMGSVPEFAVKKHTLRK